MSYLCIVSYSRKKKAHWARVFFAFHTDTNQWIQLNEFEIHRHNFNPKQAGRVESAHKLVPWSIQCCYGNAIVKECCTFWLKISGKLWFVFFCLNQFPLSIWAYFCINIWTLPSLPNFNQIGGKTKKFGFPTQIHRSPKYKMTSSNIFCYLIKFLMQYDTAKFHGYWPSNWEVAKGEESALLPPFAMPDSEKPGLLRVKLP